MTVKVRRAIPVKQVRTAMAVKMRRAILVKWGGLQCP
jgi:hypothetical protein